MADFILVHGAFHDGGTWALVQPELARLGHRSIAPDLPVDRPDAGLDDYADTVLAAADGFAAGRIYLVGHSMGGLVVPRVAARLPDARIVLLCAAIAHTAPEEMEENGSAVDVARFFGWLRPDSHGRMIVAPEHAVEAFFHDVEPGLAAREAARLKPQVMAAISMAPPIAPFAHRVAGAIATIDDRIILAEPHTALIRKRFGIEPIMLPGGHSPALAQPAAVAAALDRIVRAEA